MADYSSNIPTLAELALQYGTITKEQHTQLIHLNAFLTKEKKAPDYGALLLEQKMATSYQIELLRLIRDYHIIRRKGEEFGKIAIEKKFATPGDIRRALEIQKTEFKASRLRRLMGDILVADGVITAKQKEEVLKEQLLFDQNLKAVETDGKEDLHTDSGLDLSPYEQQFLKIQALDEEFAASVLEKDLASEQEVQHARAIQDQAFEKKKPVKILGEILVSLNYITPEQKDIILEEQGRIEAASKEEKKPVFCIRLSPDAMTAWVEIDSENGPNPVLSDIKSSLAKKKILNGIFPDALMQCCLDNDLPKFAVARKDYSTELRDARHLKSDLQTDLTEKGEKRKGDLLATQDATWKPGLRENLFGKETSAFSRMDFTIRCGSGTRPSKDKTGIIAAKTGIPALSVERFLYIHPIIHVLEDADLRYGPLEAFANLTVSGTITGAYPVTAGTVKAREIRGGIITAIGDIHTDVGITDAVIRCQGDVHARYLHNCKIETFGSVYVQNEIFDSDIRCSGMVDSPDCRIIASQIHAKKGVILAGAGSEKTTPCTITAGKEQHIIALVKTYFEEIKLISKELDDLKAEKQRGKDEAKKAFQKMVDLKVFHDKAKQRKNRLAAEFNMNKEAYDKGQLKNILKLISNFEKRMEQSIARLKDLNKSKKALDGAVTRLESKIQTLAPKIARGQLEIEKSLFACLEWARSRMNSTHIEIHGRAFQGTSFGGVYSSIRIDDHLDDFSVREIYPEENEAPFMEIRTASSEA